MHLCSPTKTEDSAEHFSNINIVILPVTLCFVLSVGWLEQNADCYDSDKTQHLRTKNGLQAKYQSQLCWWCLLLLVCLTA